MASLPEVSLITSWHAAPPTDPEGLPSLIHALHGGLSLFDLYFLAHSDTSWYINAAERSAGRAFPEDIKSCPLALASALELPDLQNIARRILHLVAERYAGRLVGPRPRFAALATYWPLLSGMDHRTQGLSVRAVQNSLVLASLLGCRHVEIVGGAAFSIEDGRGARPGPAQNRARKARDKRLNALCQGLKAVFTNERGRQLFPSSSASSDTGPFLCLEMEPGDGHLVRDVHSYHEVHLALRDTPEVQSRVLLNVDLAHMFLADADAAASHAKTPRTIPKSQLALIRDHYRLHDWIGHFHISDHARSHASDLCPGTYHYFKPDYMPWLKLAMDLVGKPKFSGAIAVELEACGDIHEVMRAVGRTHHWLKALAQTTSRPEHRVVEGVIMAVDIVNSTGAFTAQGYARDGGAVRIDLAVSSICRSVHATHGAVYSFTGDGVVAVFDKQHFSGPEQAARGALAACGALYNGMKAALEKDGHWKHVQKSVALRISLHWGQVMIPSHGALQHQALGLDVIIACRLLDDVKALMEKQKDAPDTPLPKTWVVVSGLFREQLRREPSPSPAWFELPFREHQGIPREAEPERIAGVFTLTSLPALWASLPGPFWNISSHAAAKERAVSSEGSAAPETPLSHKDTPPSPGPLRGFIAYDFVMADKTNLLNVLEYAKETQPGEKLDLRFPGKSSKAHGLIWESVVRPEIDAAEKVLAFVDLPNANVGFEIGYALGKEKQVAISRFSDHRHPWLVQPPLLGHLIRQCANAPEIHAAFLEEDFMKVPAAPSGGKDVIVLCPDHHSSPFSHQINSAWGWTSLSEQPWDLLKLPRQFAGAGRVVWIITPHTAEAAERDGSQNAALSFLAGYAEARPELDLRIFYHKAARIVVDVAERSKQFKENSELKKLLTALAEEWDPGVSGRA